MERVLLSIIIAAFNAAQTIGYCLDSLTSNLDMQTEIIVVNDGSQDKTVEICRSYISKGYNIRLFSQTNKGVSAARNLGLRHATGDYVSFVDADDYVCRNFSKKLIPILSSHQYDVIWLGNRRTKQYNCIEDFDECVSVIDISKSELDHLRATTLYYDSKYSDHNVSLEGISPCTAWGVVFLRKNQCQNGVFFNENVLMFEDGIFNFHLLHYCKTAGYIKTPMYFYVINDKSATNKYRTDWEDNFETRNQAAVSLMNELDGIRLDENYSGIVQRYYASLIYQLRIILENEVFYHPRKVPLWKQIIHCKRLLRESKFQECISKCKANVINPEELITWNQLVKKSAVEAWGYYEYRYIRHRIKQIIVYFFKRQKI